MVFSEFLKLIFLMHKYYLNGDLKVIIRIISYELKINNMSYLYKVFV